MPIAPPADLSRVRGNVTAGKCCLLGAVLSGCGFLGVELSPLALEGRSDGDLADAGPGGVQDGAAMQLTRGDPREAQVCVHGVCSTEMDRCPADDSKLWPGMCGCAVSEDDEDGDGTPDCIDRCLGEPDLRPGAGCACGAASVDADGDGVPDCLDYCPHDAEKSGPGVCGCGVSDQDSDGDGMPDCADACEGDESKVVPGVCGCMIEENDQDTDQDGVPDCIDTCGGADDSRYLPEATCGVGYCRLTNTPSSCVDGVEIACVPGSPLAGDDATCDGIDDDCDGAVDEDYQPDATCGLGHCQSTNTPSRCEAGAEVACAAGSPLSSDDATHDGVDDNCNGEVDEDACIARTETYDYSASAYTLSPGPCTRLTVRLWGGAGASGSSEGGFWISVSAGNGGAGGYAQSVLNVTPSSTVQLYVGRGAQGCGNAYGSNANASYRGGAGGTSVGQAGSRGEDGTLTGGNGASPSSGGNGGRGHFGGGGGGAGTRLYSPYGAGGAGGAASMMFVDGTRAMLAGGGGGGGGAGSDFTTAGHSGGAGGSGCSGTGSTATAIGGGGGGGGRCEGSSTQGVSGRTPHDPGGVLPADVAAGGANSSDCAPGGNGYAIISYAR